ncbi:hypothetical protein, partial [Salmonella sp. SAL4438]|uniref:hypothetical protein n=1 Tax=Salmonella sp. SAL4438 TaxID=3159893 RepID=UPI00397AFB7C
YTHSNASGDITQNKIGKNDYWIVKSDGTGSKQWDARFGGDKSDILNSVQQTTDGGYILGGRSKSNISGDKTEESQGKYD